MNLVPYRHELRERYQTWLREHDADNAFTSEQREWLDRMAEHIATSLVIEPADFETGWFGQQGSLGRDKSCDLVIMNPPFTRPTNHEASHAFSSGNAGLASNFMDLGHHKLKGVLALVVPFAFLRGKSWQSARQALKAHYSDIHVTSIAAPGSTARAFSADTGMAECLVVATKRSGGNSWAAYSNLAARPSSLLEAAVEAKNSRGRAVRGDILDAGVGVPTVTEQNRTLRAALGTA